MLNYIWFGLLILAVAIGGFQGKLQQLTDAAFDSAKTGVMSIALPLVGITALWLGLMRLAERAGLIQAVARVLRPLMRRLFPDVPPDHPAMGSMLMNMAANVIGLANAATPLGLRAMNDLQKLNPTPGTATNAMCTFLALNTSSLQLVPATAIGILAAAGAANPTAIVGTTLIATFCSTAVGLIAVKTLEKFPGYRLPSPHPNEIVPREAGKTAEPDGPVNGNKTGPWRAWQLAVVFAFVLLFMVFFVREMTRKLGVSESGLFIRAMNAVSVLAVPFLIGLMPLCAVVRGVRVYEEFVTGAREGFGIAIRVIPFLVAMLVAIGVFRAAGGVDMLGRVLSPVLGVIGFPVDLLPMALTRPLSGSATIGLFADLAKTLGPDHIVTRMGGTLLGSTETTFYVIAVYFGAISVRRARHAVVAGLLADLAGMVASVIVCRAVFGG
jgi:spore maturation protein SpmA